MPRMFGSPNADLRGDPAMGASPLNCPSQNSTSSALCAACNRAMPLRRDGNMRIHGPVNDRCQGSGRPPLSVQVDSHVSPSVASRPSLPQTLGPVFPKPIGFCEESLVGRASRQLTSLPSSLMIL